MDEAVQVLVEINEFVWRRFKRDLEGLTTEEANWRPLPQANSINLILRHLRVDAPWHVRRIEPNNDDPPPDPATTHEPADSIPLDFERNLKELDEACAGFIAGLRSMTLSGLHRRNSLAYQASPQGSVPDHLLGFHLALHLTAHEGQIRTLRNLYQKARGEPARFFPDNPTFPS